jgi:hypothetical protein
MENLIDYDYPAEATVGDQWQRGAIENFTQALDLWKISPLELHRRISQLAYRLYLRRGKIDGHDLEDWLLAEREVLNRLTHIRLELGEPNNGEEI